MTIYLRSTVGVMLLVSPIIGSLLFEAIGFRLTLNVLALVFLLNALIYSIFTCSDLGKEKREEKQREDTEEEE